jgi:hypothetical protein
MMQSLISMLFAIATIAPAMAETASTPQAGPVAVVVTVAIPPGVSRDKIIAGMQQSIPQYQAIPGLARKYFTISDDAKFGGIYLWRSRAEAEAWFSDAWRAKSAATYGSAPQVSYFDAPIVIEGSATVAAAAK